MNRRSFKQTLQDVTITIILPEPVKAKLIEVEFGNRYLKAKNKVTDEVYIDGVLFAEIIEDESTWLVDGDLELQITVEKRNQQQWWPGVLETDPQIDVTKIQPEQSKLSDLDGETRAHVEKMLFDQRQKQLGLPTNEEIQKQKALEKFKRMHPELDFTKVESNE